MSKKIIIILLITATVAAVSYGVVRLYQVDPIRFSSHGMDRGVLDESLRLGRQFLLNNQYPEGNFTYEYDFISRRSSQENSQVRQAGALWGLSLVHFDNPTEKTEKALLKGFGFFKNITYSAGDKRFPKYPDTTYGSTGTVALVALSLVEFFRIEGNREKFPQYVKLMEDYLSFLLSLRQQNKLFSAYFDYETGRGEDVASPYFDGETLLALSKAARYLGYTDFIPYILESADAMYEIYVIQALKKDPDSADTKGFYQWASMSYFEIFSARWEGKYGQIVIDMAYWMIDIHRTLYRRRNTAYAHEGMIHAWQAAKMLGKKEAMDYIGNIVERGLFKLTSWQVGGPNQTLFLKWHKTDDPKAVGGIMNSMFCPDLRIDVTQHQVHAVILARKYVYTE